MESDSCSGVHCTDSDTATSSAGSARRRLTGVLSRSFISWLEQVHELIRYIDERRRDFDGLLMERLRRHYESYAPQTPKPKKRKRKRKARKVMMFVIVVMFL